MQISTFVYRKLNKREDFRQNIFFLLALLVYLKLAKIAKPLHE